MDFAERLSQRITERDTRIVVGIDPFPNRLPAFLLKNVTPGDTASVSRALHAFGQMVVESVEPYASAVKFQISFYEQWGIPGLMALEQTLAGMAGSDLEVIMDVKRGDISTTAEAYVRAYLSGPEMSGHHYQAPWQVDAVTLNPYLGEDSLEPWVEAARSHKKGLFVLVKTSNPGSQSIQDLELKEGGAVTERVARMLSAMGEVAIGPSGYSPLGAVVGANYPETLVTLRQLLPHSYLLLPGYGAQGGKAEAIAHAFDDNGLGAVVSASRSVIFAAEPTASPGDTAKAIAESARRFRDDVNRALKQRR